MTIAIFSIIYLIVGFFTSILARLALVIPDALLLEKWVLACAALWPFSLPLLLAYFSFSLGPKAVVTRIKKNEVKPKTPA